VRLLIGVTDQNHGRTAWSIAAETDSLLFGAALILCDKAPGEGAEDWLHERASSETTHCEKPVRRRGSLESAENQSGVAPDREAQKSTREDRRGRPFVRTKVSAMRAAPLVPSLGIAVSTLQRLLIMGGDTDRNNQQQSKPDKRLSTPVLDDAARNTLGGSRDDSPVDRPAFYY
jgi:hypothetical protein